MLYQRAASRAAARRFPAPGELIDVGGHRLHVTCTGTGRPPVFLEAGIAASSLSWAAVAPSVATFTRVCTYDRAGLAWSDVPSCPRTFERIVDELATVIGRVAPAERCILVGHSFGSFVVRGYARRHPEVGGGAGPRGSGGRMAEARRLTRLPPSSCAAPRPDRRGPWRRSGIPARPSGAADRWSAGRSAAIHETLWGHRRTDARAAGRRSAQAPSGDLSADAGVLVGAEVLSRDGRPSRRA